MIHWLQKNFRWQKTIDEMFSIRIDREKVGDRFYRSLVFDALLDPLRVFKGDDGKRYVFYGFWWGDGYAEATVKPVSRFRYLISGKCDRPEWFDR